MAAIRTLCAKCQYCKNAVRLSVDWSHEEFDRCERWCACGYILFQGLRRPCGSGDRCSEFQYRARRPPSIKSGIQSGASFYSYYQRTKKGQPGDEYVPRQGDAIVLLDLMRNEPRRHIVDTVTSDRVYFFSGARGGTAVRRPVDIQSSRIIGYQTPLAAPEDPMFALAAGQEQLGIQATGVLTQDTQAAIRSALDGGAPLDKLWPTVLAGLGYGPFDTEIFQLVEDLPQTGVADWATWRRAYRYLTPRKEVCA